MEYERIMVLSSSNLLGVVNPGSSRQKEREREMGKNEETRSFQN